MLTKKHFKWFLKGDYWATQHRSLIQSSSCTLFRHTLLTFCVHFKADVLLNDISTPPTHTPTVVSFPFSTKRNIAALIFFIYENLICVPLGTRWVEIRRYEIRKRFIAWRNPIYLSLCWFALLQPSPLLLSENIPRVVVFSVVSPPVNQIWYDEIITMLPDYFYRGDDADSALRLLSGSNPFQTNLMCTA